MQELYVEGIANHDDPESCVGVREGNGEALTGAHAGRAIEPRNKLVRGADAVFLCGRPHCRRRSSRVAGEPRAVEEPVHAWNVHAREPGGPMSTRPVMVERVVQGRLRPHA